MSVTLDENRRKQFERQLERLREDKIFPPMKRDMVKGNRYLIISLGGTGADALFGIKKKFEEAIPDAQLKQYVRFLAIDTDKATKNSVIKVTRPDGTVGTEIVDSLNDNQFFLLSGANARTVVTHSLPMVDDWINPQLPAIIKNNSEMLSGTGASATRQIGRVSLFPADTIDALNGRISNLVGELTNNTADNLRVMIVSGIAGGTGSGTVIDMSYLIRHFINQMQGSIGGRTKYCGFILLPPTGNSTNHVDIQKGNQNGYAALKEIDQFMTLGERGEVYSHRYANQVVKSGSNIFDNCYLMDGVRNGVALGRDARKYVVNVLAECMLDMATSQPVDSKDDNAPQTVDSFMNDVAEQAKSVLRGKPASEAPRDANYMYCALGHCEAEIPIALMKAYVAEKVYEKMHAVFEKCDNLKDEDIEEFVKSVIVPERKYTEQAVRKNINEKVESIFRAVNSAYKGGPYYACNLLADVDVPVEKLKKQWPVFRPGNASDEQLDFIARHCSKLNHETFGVFTAVMDGMADIMAQEADIESYSTKTANSYAFCPINVTDSSGAVRKYLDGLISGKRIGALTNALLDEMIDNKDEWTQVYNNDKTTGAMDLHKVIRKFWNEQLNSVIDATLEDFLIKFYSGDPNACYDPDDPKSSDDYLETAANAIYDQMFGPAGRAHPMADFTSNDALGEADFNGHNFILVPAKAPHLMAQIKAVAASKSNQQNSVEVYSSFADDRISSYAQYTGIPAFKLNWVCRAEKDYEVALAGAKQGLHMSESVKGRLWREFPNLLPESTWKFVPEYNYNNAREKVLADMAHSLFKDADELGLTRSEPEESGSKFMRYSVKLLPAELRPDNQLFKERDLAADNSRTWEERNGKIERSTEACAQALFDRLTSLIASGNEIGYLDTALEECQDTVSFVSKNLWTPGTVLSSGPDAAEKPIGWDEKLAGCVLRKMPDTMNDLRGTIEVMKKLRAKVDAAFSANQLRCWFARYLTVELFRYNEKFYQWEYTAADGSEAVLVALETDDKIQKTAEYYFMFNALKALAEEELDALQANYYETASYDDRGEQVEKQRALKAKAVELGQEVQARFNGKNPDKLCVLGSTEYERAAMKRGYDVAGIRAFYKELANELSDLTFAMRQRN